MRIHDLGKLLFGGLLLALIVGVAVSLLHRRMKDKSAADSELFRSDQAVARNDRKLTLWEVAPASRP